MTRIKILILCALVLLLCGCVSVQVSYKETEPRKSIISEYTITKTGNEYNAKLVISGRVVNEIGQPIHDRQFNLMAVEKSYSFYPDDQGYINKTIESSLQYMPNNRITIAIDDMDANGARDAYLKGNKVSFVVPLEIAYNIGMSSNAIQRQDLIPEEQSNGTDRDKIGYCQVFVDSFNNIINLKEYTFSSEKNLRIQQER